MPRKWIGRALSKHRKGTLRARLHEAGLMGKTDKRIPRRALDKAASGALGPVTQKRAVLVRTLRKFH